jgi:hypothetical protein
VTIVSGQHQRRPTILRGVSPSKPEESMQCYSTRHAYITEAQINERRRASLHRRNIKRTYNVFGLLFSPQLYQQLHTVHVTIASGPHQRRPIVLQTYGNIAACTLNGARQQEKINNNEYKLV